jgi:hypothetical protein
LEKKLVGTRRFVTQIDDVGGQGREPLQQVWREKGSKYGWGGVGEELQWGRLQWGRLQWGRLQWGRLQMLQIHQV